MLLILIFFNPAICKGEISMLLLFVSAGATIGYYIVK